MAKDQSPKPIETILHPDDTRKNIPTAEYQALVEPGTKTALQVAFERRNRDLDPQLVWRGKDEADWSDLVVSAPPLYIQEKVHPKVLIDDLVKQSQKDQKPAEQFDLFADFNGLPNDGAKTEFYQHDAHWTNRMILGDSLQVMASLAEREGLRGKVQCIYLDPPYGIKFNSNFQWSTTSRDVKDGNIEHITREPEQVKAFRDTWRDGIHSYLTYLRDRLTVARDLLTESGSIFVQIGDENVHRVRALMDEVFGEDNNCGLITFQKTSGQSSPSAKTNVLTAVADYLLWYCKKKDSVKYRDLFLLKGAGSADSGNYRYLESQDGQRRSLTPDEMENPASAGRSGRIFRIDNMTSAQTYTGASDPFVFRQRGYTPPGNRGWSTKHQGLENLARANRIHAGGSTLSFVRFIDDFPVTKMNNVWTDTITSGFGDPKTYVVQTLSAVIARCIQMTTDPGDLVLDPTCGSGTTAFVAEQWGRRWITIDTSRVALALARARIMGARYPYYLLADSPEGQQKEGEVTRTAIRSQATYRNIKHGFVYERVPHITLKSIANNSEIDVIWDQWQTTLESLRQQFNAAAGKTWEEWEIPRDGESGWPEATKKVHADWWKARIARQKEIDASIAAKAEYEYLFDKPYEDKRKVRVAGPFTVESLSPHRAVALDEDDNLVEEVKEPSASYDAHDFTTLILDNLRTAGVQQAHKDDKVTFTSLVPWPGEWICAEGRYDDKRAGIFLGPEFGTVSRPDLVEAAREAADAGFDVLISCAFNYDAHSTGFDKLGRITILKARMNADLHMADDLRNNGKGNLFVIFGEPDIEIQPLANGQIQVEVKGVDVFHPSTGEVRSDGPDGIACWFLDTDYNEESFFVRHAYFLGANDPYSSLKTTLRAEVNADAWATLNSAVSRPFDKPKTGRIAVKVINHLGDEVMKVFRV